MIKGGTVGGLGASVLVAAVLEAVAASVEVVDGGVEGTAVVIGLVASCFVVGSNDDVGRCR